MRLRLVHPVIIAGATALAAPAMSEAPTLPLASRFDLAEATLRPAYAGAMTVRDELSDQFSLPELAAPPMPPHRPAKLRIRGKKVKLRLPFG
jgi:hypothetical protein